jgi:hypothetical protein
LAASAPAEVQEPGGRRKGPLSFLSGALSAGLLAWLCLGLSRRVVVHYALHPPSYSSAIAQSIATALKTLMVGMAFLATFSFAFIALGLGLVFLRSLVPTAAGATHQSPSAQEAPASTTTASLNTASLDTASLDTPALDSDAESKSA